MASSRQNETELTAVAAGPSGPADKVEVDPTSTSVYKTAMGYAESFKGMLQVVGVPAMDDLRQTTSAAFLRGTPGTFALVNQTMQVREDCGVARITVRRLSGTAPCVIRYKTAPVTAVAGPDYNSVSNGSLKFAFEQAEASVEVLVFDDDGYEDDKTFKVVLHGINHGHIVNEEGNVLKAAVCLVTIKDNDFDLPRIIVTSTWFTAVTALATVYALFGTEIAQIHAVKKDDFLLGCVTGTVAGIFFLEIAFTLYVRGRKYAGTVMFFMDLIAMLALIPLIPAVAQAMSSLSSFSETGVLARAGRAARAGSRAGRTIKLPRLIAKMTEFAAGVGKMAADARKLAAASKNAKLLNEGETLKAAEVSRKAAEDKAVAAEEGGPSASKVGAALLELFTGKVIVMMLLLLVLSSFLLNEVPATQQLMGLDMLHAAYVQGGNSFNTASFKHTLWVYTEGGGGVGERWSTTQKLLYLKIDNQVVPRLDPASISSDNRANEWGVNLRYANETETTIAGGTGAAQLWWNDDAQLSGLRESELRYASDKNNAGCSRVLEKGVKAHRSAACPEVGAVQVKSSLPIALESAWFQPLNLSSDFLVSKICFFKCNLYRYTSAAIFDNKDNMDKDALFSLVMTCSIVVILGIGMGLIASDLQVLILDPVERLTSLIKTLMGTVLGGNDDDDTEEGRALAKQKKAAKKTAGKVDKKTAAKDALIEAGGARSTGFLGSAVGMAMGSSSSSGGGDDDDEDGSGGKPSMMDNVMKSLVMVQAAFPPDEPLIFFIEALNDVEGAFGFKLEAIRRTMIQLQEFMKAKLRAVETAQELAVTGTMTMRQAREVFDEMVDTERLPDDLKGAALSNPYVQVGTGRLCHAGTCPKLHAPVLAKVPKIHPKYPKYRQSTQHDIFDGHLSLRAGGAGAGARGGPHVGVRRGRRGDDGRRARQDAGPPAPRGAARADDPGHLPGDPHGGAARVARHGLRRQRWGGCTLTPPDP
jgi:hypothetical protein